MVADLLTGVCRDMGNDATAEAANRLLAVMPTSPAVEYPRNSSQTEVERGEPPTVANSARISELIVGQEPWRETPGEVTTTEIVTDRMGVSSSPRELGVGIVALELTRVNP